IGVVLFCLTFSFWTSTTSVVAAAASPSIGYTARVPILMYHYVRLNPIPYDRVGAYLSVTPKAFAQQMAYLVSGGYTTVTLDDVIHAVLTGKALPQRPAGLTFDDGYEACY